MAVPSTVLARLRSSAAVAVTAAALAAGALATPGASAADAERPLPADSEAKRVGLDPEPKHVTAAVTQEQAQTGALVRTVFAAAPASSPKKFEPIGQARELVMVGNSYGYGSGVARDVISLRKGVAVLEAEGDLPERAYAALDKVEKEVVGNSSILWRDATGDFVARVQVLTERLAYAPSALGNLLGETKAVRKKKVDGGFRYTAAVEHVQVEKDGTYDKRGYEPGVDPYPGSVSLVDVVTDEKNLILAAVLATAYKDGSVVRMTQRMTYDKRIERHPAEATVLSPEKSSALVATTDNISELDRLEKVARKRFAKVAATLEEVTGLFEQLAEESFVSLSVERKGKAVVVAGRDAYNNEPLFLLATIKAGRLELSRV